MSKNLDITINDFENICRTCLSRNNLKSLYEKSLLSTSLTDMLISCTPIKFAEDDGLPAKICTNCIREINQAFSFVKRCESTDAFLRKCVKIGTELAQNSSQSQNVEAKDKIKSEIILPDDHRPLEVLENYEFVRVKQEELIIKDESDTVYESYEQDDNEPQINDPKEDGLTERKEKVNPILSDAFHCSECDRKYPTKIALQRHFLIHGEKKFLCLVCSRGFVSQTILNSHLKIHTRPYACLVCGKAFSFSSSLKCHNLTHMDAKPHVCSICSKSFTQPAYLKDHMRTHTGEKPYSCEICSKAFALSSNLKRHMIIHTGTKPYTCNVCNKAFTRQTDLATHMRMHTGEKAYTCQVCSKAFTLPNSLRNHMIIHSEEKPFSCEFCGKSFGRKGVLTIHKKMHTGEKPYICSFCGKGFHSSSAMKRHKSIHNEPN